MFEEDSNMSKNSKKKLSNHKYSTFSRSAVLKTLSCAALAGLVSFSGASSHAAETEATIDLSSKPITSATLDYLKENNILIPQKGAYDEDDKTWAEAAPISSPGSSYTLTQVDAESDNTITKFEWNEETETFVPVYYRIDLKETEINNKPTLDYLKENNILIPQKGAYDKSTKTWAEAAPISSPGSSYTLTQVDAESDNTITKFELNGETSTLAPVYYQIDLKKTEYGHLDGGGSNLTPATVLGTEIKYYIDSSRLAPNRITEPLAGADLDYNFIGNYDNVTDGIARGGAIGNYDTIGNITGDFIGNYAVAKGKYSDAEGGAIRNSGTIGNIIGDFIGNYASGRQAFGGAIYNGSASTIDNITGDFIGNYTSGIDATGGAIENSGHIGHITGDFIGNYTISTNGNVHGGAIFNTGTIGNITGDFIENYIASSSYRTYGGAIFNTGIIGNITGDFIGNYAKLPYNTNTYDKDAYGGAIYNSGMGVIGNVTGDFIGNYAITTGSGYSGNAFGGAIYNGTSSDDYRSCTIGDITGDFIGNYAKAIDGERSARGGAIYNNNGTGIVYISTIGNITGDFIGNYVMSPNSSPTGGAIYNGNASTIGNITGDFIGNYAMSTNRSASGGAIYNSGTLGHITGDFLWNYASGINASGGAIYNSGTIGNIIGDFIGNADGGAIYNRGTLGNITGDFLWNYDNATDNVANGGAISNGNASTIGNITGDFIGNYANATGNYAYGGAIDNNGPIGNITGDFIGNYAMSTGNYAYGGAISNSAEGSIGNITGDFIGNYAMSTGNYAYGGAISNSANGSIGNITGDFIGNYAMSTNSYAYGGAIYNYYEHNKNTIGNITGNLIGNYASGYKASGGAIYNGSSNSEHNPRIIGDISGDFIGNYANDTGIVDSDIGAYGGAIYNGTYSIIGNQKGRYFGGITNSNFTSNYAKSEAGTAQGGAISNGGTIGLQDSRGRFNGGITNSNFTNNYAKSEAEAAQGGAIFNGDKIGNIISNFTGNYASGNSSVYGGAIYNSGAIGVTNQSGKVTGGIRNSNFTNNYVKSESGTAQGGAIWTNKDLKIIANKGTSTFQGNYVQVGDGEKDYQAIYVGSNSATLTLEVESKGTIYMYDYIDGETGYGMQLTGDSNGTIKLYNGLKHANVSTDTVTVDMANGELYNYEFNKLTANENTKYNIDINLANKTSDIITTAIESSGRVTLNNLNILGDFEFGGDTNYKVQILHTQNDDLQLALSAAAQEQLGNDEMYVGETRQTSLDAIKADTNWKDIYNEYVKKTKLYGKLDLATTVTTNDSIGLVISRSEEGEWVVSGPQGDTLTLWNTFDTTEEKNFNFDTPDDKYTLNDLNGVGETKGSIVNVNGVINGNDRSTIDLNHRKGFELVNETQLNIKNVNLINAVSEKGSAIKSENENASITLTNVNLSDNVSTENGAAIYSKSDVNINVDNSTTEISNNVSNDTYEAIYLANPDKTLTLNTVNNGTLIIKDKTNGTDGYNVAITGDNSSVVKLENDITGKANVSLTETTLHLSNRDNVLDGNNLTLNSGMMSMINNQVGVSALNSLTVTGDTNFVADVDLANKEMDRFTANSYGTHNGNLNVVGMNLLSDAAESEDVTAVYFAEPGLKNNVANVLDELPQNQYQNFEVYSPIHKYNVTYDKENEYDGKGDGGYFLFARGDKHITQGGGTGSTGNPSDAFNPAVLSAPVSSIAASQATINETFKYVFEHADAFTQMPQMERMSQIQANKYALSTDYNNNLDLHEHGSGSLCYEHENNKAAWVRPYTTFESMDLRHGPKVDAITYGTLVGYDGDFKEMKHGWHRIGTSYIGYNGSQLSYSGNDTTMNGGLLGMTETFYKGNFWTALTASAGASVGETHTMYGKEDFTSLLAGIGSKTGYNFEFKEGKLIVQPIMFMSYTFVNTFDYTNAAGVSIDTKPAHSLQLNPSIRIISNLKNGWQPYASVGMVWNLMNESNVTANGVKLPEMSMKPYVEYGLGVQRNWKDKFTAFGQAMVRNGGRNGIALTAGFRWAIGRDPEKDHNHEQVYRPTKKVVKKASL